MCMYFFPHLLSVSSTRMPVPWRQEFCLSSLLPNPYLLEQYLAYGTCSINIYGMNYFPQDDAFKGGLKLDNSGFKFWTYNVKAMWLRRFIPVLSLHNESNTTFQCHDED